MYIDFRACTYQNLAKKLFDPNLMIDIKATELFCRFDFDKIRFQCTSSAHVQSIHSIFEISLSSLFT